MKEIKQSIMDRCTAIFLILIIILLSYSGFVLNKNMVRFDNAIKYQEKALELAHEMEDTSNKLTDLARSFVNSYNLNDLNEYWNEVNIKRTRENIIFKLMSMDMSEEEQLYLKKAKEESDILKEVEIHAMSLVVKAVGFSDGKIPMEIAQYEISLLEQGLSKEEKINFAKELVFGQEYREGKRDIRANISKYRKMTEELISKEFNLTVQSSNNAFNLQNLFLAFLLVGGVSILLFYYTQIALPVKDYTSTVEEYSNKFELPKLIPKGSMELRKLAEAFNKNSEEIAKIESSLRETEYKLKLHIHLMPLAAIEYDYNFNITHWNKAAEKIFGYAKDEAIGKSPIGFITPKDEHFEYDKIINRLKAGDKTAETNINKNITKDGREIICEWYNTPIFDPNDNVIGWLSLGKDITKEKEEQNRVLYLSQHDPLTGLYNRGFIMEQLEMENARFKRTGIGFSVVILDIDFFKKINDNYGHECGDEVLKRVADIMIKTIRQTDFIGRWGGEEFVIVLPFTDTDGAYVLAEKIRKNIEQEDFIYKDKILKITITAGVACCCKVDSITDCIRIADEALLQGKATGRNKVIEVECK